MFILSNALLQARPEGQLWYQFILAYIDPGTGSYLFQLLIAALLGAGFAVRTFRRKISNIFLMIINRSQKTSNQVPAGPDEPSTPENPGNTPR
jgi:hypothetical protein